MGFTKLDEGILRSSIMAKDSDTFKVWIALLASCDYDGIARVSAIFLSSVCHLPIKIVEKALFALESPDKHSRSTEDDGRRIKRVSGGYFVINYGRMRRGAHLNNTLFTDKLKQLDILRRKGIPVPHTFVLSPKESIIPAIA